MEERKDYTDDQFKQLVKRKVFQQAQARNKTRFTTSELKEVLEELRVPLNTLYKRVSWAQTGDPSYSWALSLSDKSLKGFNPPMWNLFSFSDRFVRNMRKVFESTEGLAFEQKEIGTYTVRGWEREFGETSKQVPRYQNIFIVNL